MNTDEMPRRAGYETVRQAVAATVTGNARAKHFKINSANYSDILRCRSYDPETDTEGVDDIYVAKPWFLRGKDTWNQVSRRLITYGNYTSDGQRRDATSGTSFERQRIVPAFFVGDIIIAVSASTGLTVPNTAPPQPVTWQDLNVDGRMWARE